MRRRIATLPHSATAGAPCSAFPNGHQGFSAAHVLLDLAAMITRLALVPILTFVALAGCAAASPRAVDAAQVQVGAAATTAPGAAHRCPASRPGRQQPALGIRCY